MTKHELNALLAKLPALRIGVIGDFCLDAYWMVDLSASEGSLETGLPTRPVRKQRYSLGGAGNVADNLIALGVGTVRVFGVIGDDPFGGQMRRILEERRADLAALLTQPADWHTPVYVKPIREEHEESRIDFGSFNQLHDATAEQLLVKLEAGLAELDGVIINQQLTRGLHTPYLQAELNRIIARHPAALFVVDSRHFPEHYAGCVHKLNAREAARLCGASYEPGEIIEQDEIRRFACELYRRWAKTVFITNGPRGCVAVSAEGVQAVSGLHIVRRTDPVGAGDSLLAGVTAALAGGCTPLQAATFGNFAAGVTVQKVFQTGTATPEEVRAIGEDPDYVYEPGLADDPRKARYSDGLGIVLIEPPPPAPRLTHAIFDHDGTLSTLRQGWEQVMEPVMVRAILGEQYASAGETLYARVVNRVREFIDQTTGVQTLVQMQGLVDLVREFGLVPEPRILDEHGYKRIYNDALMAVVRERTARLRKGELDVSDFTIKNSVALLRRLAAAGLKLYLASGTDEQDVVAEAEALGYADLFEGRIYGAVGDVTREAKRIVLDRILADIGEENVARVVTFGDGPVEIRQTRKRGGLAVGVASDEVRRFQLNPAKRSRLIRAGAHLIVPDYSQLDGLLALLGVGPRGKRN